MTTNEVYLRSNIFELWHDKEFSDFKGDPKALANTVKVLQSTEHRKNGIGVLLYGANGRGKTMLMNLSFKALVQNRKTVYIVPFPDLVGNYVKNWKGEGAMNKLLSVQYLGIDDIGKEFAESNVSKELVISALDYVLRYRRQRKLITWVTTNHDISEIAPLYGDSLASLFNEMFVNVLVKGDDYRKVIKPKV